MSSVRAAHREREEDVEATPVNLRTSRGEMTRGRSPPARGEPSPATESIPPTSR